ncbi:tail sheath stabilizer and completion protein [uncultured Caudovirales phage]|uniref:Tail sheath stabilizer and completion protein n=1 Tax=uncultured Caudovirales phage TaxID=2100421 RepID=A0A6J5SCN9_9CAUD|nr:tail sheath stabilizer and completion protein [uncultured Caudovirales phage]CAB4182031.1 tail sheath stabilizer and completion protein [uncultured Caudovirales phage]CAB4198703.1 tail sheath stabilizer and completion protein [uncultured Caudovirales phage]CAB4211575.1 tail sheath stabilizer and completion protein [uncultured Caudovirales phage]CAB5238688.1 tail sheath stabilizer and completion protein [uncultured Caudovirales phage]
MLNSNVYYHGIIRKCIVGFGSLFSDIYIDRREGDSVTGTVIQRLQVPLAYAPKEKWIVRLEQDPTLENNVYTTLPRMSFEIIGYNYDSQRKVNRMQQLKCGDGTGSVSTMYTPVPYNLDLSLYILTKTQEDGLQIIEQILPTFTPEYTLSINVVPDMSVKIDVPIVLNSVSVQDDYDGDFQMRRFVTHSLNFQMKMNLFGPISGRSIIDTVYANIGENEDFTNANRIYTAEGDVTTATVDTESWLDGF